ncbi:FecCD family ABC transporter permease [Streptomyces sp. NPDC091279]|uniref:FecCD family ABC transporter permease n=1 Tax=unclassified Streptomyces TaxID=2593676 RepID=UPI00381FB84E
MPRRPVRVLGLGSVAVRFRPRGLVVCAVLLLLIVAVGLCTLATGDYAIPVPDVARALLGGGDAATRFVVDSLRAPRLVVALLVGAALGPAGAVFQSITRNPLGSPDIIGFGAGASCGAVAVLVLFHGGPGAVSAGATAGGLGTAAAVYLMALRRRALSSLLLILVGIGVTGMLTAFNEWLLTRASLNDAETAQRWLTGSLSSASWGTAVPLGIGVAVLLPVLLLLGRRLDLMEMGDDCARALGIPAERVRLAAVVLAVGLVAFATAAAGPVAFVALASTQVARRLTRTPGVGLTAAALTGALLTTLSDLAGQHAFPSAQLPVGVATACLGGGYLGLLLLRQGRAAR